MNLRQEFGNDFSKSAFRVIDGELRIVGKYGEIAINDDNEYDIWIVMENREPMNGLRLNNLIDEIGGKLERDRQVTKLDGEAYGQTAQASLVRETGPQLGIRRRYRYSEEQLEARRAHMAKIRGER